MIGWLIIVPLSICAAARAARLEESSSLLLLATGLTPLLGPPAVLALGIGLRQRRRPLAVVSAATAAAHLYSALSGLGVPVRAPSPAGTLPALRLFNANVYQGNRDLGPIGQEIRATAPDLVALQEVDPDGAADLQRSGVLAAFPYAVTEFRQSPSGIGLWSRFPIADGQVRDVHGMAVIEATILLGAHRLRLYIIHTVAPLGDDRARWRAQLLWVEEEIRRGRGPVVVAGDFNATRYHSSFRRLLSDRLADAHERRGRGWAATWPRDRWPLPPLMRLDHVLVSPDIGVRSVKEGLGQGSDHRPIIAELVLRSGAAAPSPPGTEGTAMTEASAKDYWESLHRRSYGLQSVGYVGVGTPFNAWMYRLRRRVFRQAVHQFLRPRDDLEILDVGSGTGFYLDRWHELGFRNVHASDVSEVAVERLRERYPSCEVAQLDIGDQSAGTLQRRFDVVSIIDVLFHITSDRRYERAFANLASLVKPNGLLVFSENFVHQRNPREAQQVNRSLVEIESLLRKAGFETLARRPMFVLMNCPVDSTSRVHRLCWRVLELAMVAWNPLGAVLGAVLYPLELALVARLKEGPSTELMLCRRLPDP